MGLGGVSPPESQDIFENLVLKYCPLVASESQREDREEDDSQRGGFRRGGAPSQEPRDF